MARFILIYGLLLAVILIALNFLQYSFLSLRISMELYMGLIALAFLGAGLWVGRSMRQKNQAEEQPETPTEAEAVPMVPSPDALEQTGISKREHEVLLCLARGYSNQEIADELFVSLNTIKTHLNSLYVKLDVKRRTQAVVKAKELNLIT